MSLRLHVYTVIADVWKSKSDIEELPESSDSSNDLELDSADVNFPDLSSESPDSDAGNEQDRVNSSEFESAESSNAEYDVS